MQFTLKQKTRHLIAFGLISFSAAMPVWSVERDSFEDKKEAVDALFAPYDGAGRPGLAVGVYHKGKVIYANGFGMANMQISIGLRGKTRMHSTVPFP